MAARKKSPATRKKPSDTRKWPPSKTRLKELIEEAIVDAYDDEEVLSAFTALIQDELAIPFETEILGVPVTVEAVDSVTAQRPSPWLGTHQPGSSMATQESASGLLLQSLLPLAGLSGHPTFPPRITTLA